MNAGKNNFVLTSVHMIIYNNCKGAGCGRSKSCYLESKTCQLVVWSAPNLSQSMTKTVLQARSCAGAAAQTHIQSVGSAGRGSSLSCHLHWEWIDENWHGPVKNELSLKSQMWPCTIELCVLGVSIRSYQKHPFSLFFHPQIYT